MKFQIGDTIWFASTGTREKRIVCPDCEGSRYIRVILADDIDRTIDCNCCERGWEGSRGTLYGYEHFAEAALGVIKGAAINSEGEEVYSGDGFYEKEEVFATKEEADEVAEILALERTESEEKRMRAKEKEERTWAWNVTYHRRAIKQAEKDLAYHSAKLDVARQYVKVVKA